MATLGKEVPASAAQKQIFHFIDGKHVEGQSGRGGKVYNPVLLPTWRGSDVYQESLTPRTCLRISGLSPS